MLVVKTAGRTLSLEERHATTAAADDNDACDLPDPDDVAFDADVELDVPPADVTFGIFVASKWSHNMVKKDVEGEGLLGDRSVWWFVLCASHVCQPADECILFSCGRVAILFSDWTQRPPR